MSESYENDLKELKEKLKEKDETINSYLDRIEMLEDNIMKLEALIDEAETKGSFDSEKVQETKLAIELTDREKKIRELKDKMGFLRKETLNYRKRIEELEKEQDKTTNQMMSDTQKEQISMDTLVKELQSKINKQKQIINSLQQEGGAYASSSKYEAQLKEKDQKIQDLENKIQQLSKKEAPDMISRSLTEELQLKLNRTRQQVKVLQETIESYKKAGTASTAEPTPVDTEMIEKLEQQNAELIQKLEGKTNEVQVLSQKIEELQKASSTKAPSKPAEATAPSPLISDLTKELQEKLNKRKLMIEDLQAELKILKEKATTKTDQEGYIEELKEELASKTEKIKHLQDKINERERIVQEADVSKLDTLRVNELKRMIKELEKLTNQQREEIYALKTK
ncbi:MAG: hypothetical protein BAJALOKI1v1_2060004 [Promethearchaeota archaeon]|nr:MAG: hypothetical protein BAJALOKI1v1_2060004 [Candidatus Lokiarchaeota archaeon]